jgi:hypothetical protein
MRLLMSIVEFGSGLVQPQHQHRARRQVRRQSCLETLESRRLLTGLSGVTLAQGELIIHGPLQSGNTATVSIDSTNNDVKLTLNGSAEEFAPGLVTWISYTGGSGGGDSFTNDTSLHSWDFGYGGGNTFTGGTGLDIFNLYGNDNVVDNQGAPEIVLTNGGSDTIAPDSGGLLVIK